MKENSSSSSAIDLLLVDTTENESNNYVLYHMGYLGERFALKTETAEWTKRCIDHKEKNLEDWFYSSEEKFRLPCSKKADDED